MEESNVHGAKFEHATIYIVIVEVVAVVQRPVNNWKQSNRYSTKNCHSPTMSVALLADVSTG